MPELNTLAKPQPLARMARQAIRDAILNGRLKSGEIYNEKAMAADLGISRTPVHEALLELAVIGLVSFLPRRGIIINDYDPRDIHDIFQIRQALELWVIGEVAGRRPPVDMTGLELSITNQEKALADDDYLAFMEADRSFHTVLVVEVDNPRMLAILDGIRDQVQVMGLGALARIGRGGEVVKEHQRIIDAIRAGDVTEARQAMAVHLENSRAAVDTQRRKAADV